MRAPLVASPNQSVRRTANQFNGQKSPTYYYPLESHRTPPTLMRMVFRTLLIMAVLSMGACSKLGDLSPADTANVPVPTPSVAVTVPDPIHEWAFDSNGNDSVGSWTGTLNGGSYTTTAGEVKVGTAAAKFAAGDDFSLGAQTFPAEMTIACWVRWISGTGPNTIVANSATGANTDGFRFYAKTTGQLVLETGTGSAGVAVNSVTSLTTATYTHVAVILDGVLNQSAIYVNGALDQSGTVQSGFNLTTAAFLGSMAGATNSFSGELDDCKVFNVALSSAQMTLLYNSY
jgi:hypothetical protein